MYNTQEPKRRRKKFCVTFMAKFPILYILYVYNGNNLKIPKMTIIWYFSRENKTVVIAIFDFMEKILKIPIFTITLFFPWK